MTDIVDPKTRSRIMSRIRGKDTKPELILRKGLHGLGFRFRLHRRDMPGRPDMVFARYRAVIFVHGCFWHGHSCHLFKWPKTREDFWKNKIERNRSLDRDNIDSLLRDGWRVAVVWECSMRGKHRLSHEEIVARCAEWLLSEVTFLEIGGRN